MIRPMLFPLLLLPLLAACAKEPITALPTDRVRDEAAAISLAQAACTALAIPTQADDWDAELYSGTWYVRIGYTYEVRIVAADGTASACEQQIIIG